jgi:type II secretory pathway pseudopilin PulG
MTPGVVIALIGLAGVLLLPWMTDVVQARRARINERTSAREREAAALIRAHDDAMQALREQLEDMTADRNWWRDTCIAQGDGWYGMRRDRS